MPFNLGPTELIVILAVALIVFGPKKLPEIGKGIGKAMRDFQRARNDFMDSIHSDLDDEPARATAPSSTVPASGSAERKIEYPEPLEADASDALPYGGDFHPTEGDSQPVYRPAEADAGTVAARSSAQVGEARG